MPVGRAAVLSRIRPDGLAERRWPTRADLDAAAPDHPVYIRGIWGYWNRPPVYSIANSAALARAGITRDTAPPRGRRDPEGRRRRAHRRLRRAQPHPGDRVHPDEGGAALHATTTACARSATRCAATPPAGVTAVYEGHGIAPEVLRVYRESHERGELRLRCSLALSPTWDAAEAERAIPELAAWAGGRGLGDDRLRVAGICLHYGGDAERRPHPARGPALHGVGGLRRERERPRRVRAQAELAARHGLRVNTIVTRCLPEVLDAWEAIARRHPIRDLRWTLVHLHVATPEPARAHPRARRRGHHQSDQLSLALGAARGGEARRRGGAAPAPPEPGPPRHPVRPGHRQQAGQSVARLRRRRRPPRHGARAWSSARASGSRARRRCAR